MAQGWGPPGGGGGGWQGGGPPPGGAPGGPPQGGYGPPPGGGYGPPPGGAPMGAPPPMGAYGNPYAPGALPVGAPGAGEGSLGIGIALGFFLGCFGLIGCLIWGKPQTKKGSFIGFGVVAALNVILAIASG